MTKLKPDAIEQIALQLQQPEVLGSIDALADSRTTAKIVKIMGYFAKEQEKKAVNTICQITSLPPEDAQLIINDQSTYQALSTISTTSNTRQAYRSKSIDSTERGAIQKLSDALTKLFS